MAAPSAQRQRVCEYWAKVPIHSRRRRRRQEVPAWHNGPNTCGEERLHGADTPTASSLASRARPVDAAAGHVPRLLAVSNQHVPPGPAPADTTPRPQPALRAQSRVGRRGAKGPNPQGREGGLKNSIERQGFETWPSFEIWDATFLVRQKRTFCTRSPELF